ncbi:MAG: hypothetical protein Q9163_001974 [Psora crenata]
MEGHELFPGLDPLDDEDEIVERSNPANFLDRNQDIMMLSPQLNTHTLGRWLHKMKMVWFRLISQVSSSRFGVAGDEMAEERPNIHYTAIGDV